MTLPSDYSDKFYYKCQVELKAYELSSKVLKSFVSHVGRSFSRKGVEESPIEKEYGAHSRELHQLIAKGLCDFSQDLNHLISNRFIRVFSLNLKKFDDLVKRSDLIIDVEGLKFDFIDREFPRESSHIHEEFGPVKIDMQDIILTPDGREVVERVLAPFIRKYDEKLLPSLEMYRDGTVMHVTKKLETLVQGNEEEGFFLTLKLVATYKKQTVKKERLAGLKEEVIKTYLAVRYLKDDLRRFRADYREICVKAHECNQWLAKMPQGFNAMLLPYDFKDEEVIEDRETMIQSERVNYNLYLDVDAAFEKTDSYSRKVRKFCL